MRRALDSGGPPGGAWSRVGPPPNRCLAYWRKSRWPTSWAWVTSASGNTIAPSMGSRPPAWSWGQPPLALGEIRLTIAVSIPVSDDRLRVLQQASTVDLPSGGRTEIMVGGGSSTTPFPLFGFDLEDCRPLFREQQELLLRVREEERVVRSGRHRPALDGQGCRE